jgi:hypothetical protein
MDLKPSPHLLTMPAYRSHTLLCVHIYLACPFSQAISWSEWQLAYVWVIYFNEKKEMIKISTVFRYSACSMMEFSMDTDYFASYI